MQSSKNKIQNSGTRLRRTRHFLFLIFAFSIWTLPAEAAVVAKPSNLLTLNSGLVGWWTLDGTDMNWGSGAVADKSGSGNTGYVLGMSTTTSPVHGKVGSAFSFDGVNDEVIMDGTSILDFSQEDAFTVAVWARPSSAELGAGILFSRGGAYTSIADTVYYLGAAHVVGAGRWEAEISDGTNMMTLISDAGTLVAGEWQYMTLTWNGNTLTLYRNGQSIGTQTGTFGTLWDGDEVQDRAVSVGAEGRGNRYYWKGHADDVRVYNRALTAAEIRALYNAGTGRLAASSRARTNDGLNQGLVAYWSLDGMDVNWATGAVADRSGNGYTGYVIGMSTTTSPVRGKIGGAFLFDTTNTVNAGDVTGIENQSAISASVWIKRNRFGDGNGRNIIEKAQDTANTTFIVALDSPNERPFCEMRNAAQTGVYAFESEGDILDFEWHHIVCTYDGANVRLYKDGVLGDTAPALTGLTRDGSASFNIGDSDFQGVIDEVRLYNRALSADEVRRLYIVDKETISATPSMPMATSSCTSGLTCGLVGHWTFDGPDVNWSSGAVTDKSGQGNTGYVVNMSTTTSPTRGKLGAAFSFDGVNDYVRVPDTASLTFGNGTTDQPFSMSAWIYYTGSSGGLFPIGVKYNDASAFDGEYAFSINETSNIATAGADQLYVQLLDDGSTNRIRIESIESIPRNTWLHVVMTYNGSGANTGVEMYKNGELISVDRATQGTYTAMDNEDSFFSVGSALVDWSTQYYGGGKIDDVRIYNRVLSATEIRQLYQMGR